eukprot:GILK01001920.1.p1 GENE.GILK01001920.1~~GILK01001920.1.p1  ORF type:complete len:939 (-),score=229.96 GILK01001920.1:138-2912(-)
MADAHSALQYHDGEDLPPFASAQNRALDQEIKQDAKTVARVDTDIDEFTERVTVMKEHFKNVQQELLQTQGLVDSKQKEIDTEDHMKQLAERQAGRLIVELNRLGNVAAEYQDRLNNLQNAIFRGNEKMDQFKLEMNWNQDELEQWALAARQKEEDNITLEKYKRADDSKIKELTLQIEKLTMEVDRKKQLLDLEVTETQAAQIELDRTAEEFRTLHKERQLLVQQWEEAVEAMQRRDEAIRSAGEAFAQAKAEMKEKQERLADKKAFLEEEENNNRQIETQISASDRTLGKLRTDFQRLQGGLQEFRDEVDVLKNQLSAAALDLANKRIQVLNANKELEDKKQKYELAQKRFAATKKKLESEYGHTDNLEKASKQAEQFYADTEKRNAEVERDLKLYKDSLFKQSQSLFKLRQEESNVYGEISGANAALKNLQANIQKLDQESLRQQELLYNAEFQIQLMERKVARASGERTAEEKEALENRIKELQSTLEQTTAQWNILNLSMKRLSEDLRAAQREKQSIEKEKEVLNDTISELTLENEMAQRELMALVREKEETLVQHDVMKLDVKRLRGALNQRADEVFGLENRKYQLQMSMEEREREISVHRDILRAEERAAEEERHKVALDVTERRNKIRNLKLKYEAIIQRSKNSEEMEEEHTQAYYVIKAAQEREELQRKGDELDAKIRKAEREIRALENTLNHLTMRNQKYRTSLSKADASGAEADQKRILEEQCRQASEVLFKKKKELQKLEREYEDDMRRLMELQTQANTVQKGVEELQSTKQTHEQELREYDEKIERAYRVYSSKMKAHKTRADLNDTESSIEEQDMQFQAIREQNRAVLVSLRNLCDEYPELESALVQSLSSKGLSLPARPASGFSRPQSSVASSRSQRGDDSRPISSLSRKSAASARSSGMKYVEVGAHF